MRVQLLNATAQYTVYEVIDKRSRVYTVTRWAASWTIKGQGNGHVLSPHKKRGREIIAAVEASQRREDGH
jgi:hypothetical protein